MKKDYYEVLGISKGATDEEIKRSYHKLVQAYHPDKHFNNPLQKLAEERFREIQEAYEVLSDKEKRQHYENGMDSKASDAESSRLSYYMESSAACYEQRLFDKALEILEQAIREFPEVPELHSYKGIVYHGKGDANRAIGSFNKALQMGMIEPEVYAHYGNALFEIGNLPKAAEMLEKAVELKPLPDYIAYLAVVYEKNGWHYKANECWERLRRIDPNNELLKSREATFKVGDTYIEKKDVASVATGALCCISSFFCGGCGN